MISLITKNYSLLIFFFVFSAFADDIKSLDLSFQNTTVLNRAIQCVPSNDGGGFRFCDGLILEKDATQKLMTMNFEQCKKEIESFGHHFAFSAPEEAKQEFNEFISSTNRALVLHDKKIVFFKPDARKIDCIHELIHVYQRAKCTKDALCPQERVKKSKEMLSFLDQMVNDVAQKEKEGKIDEAKRLADRMGPYIKAYQKWEDAVNWLDEKDVHFFIFTFCDRLGCEEEDREIALANLYKLRDYFPPRFLSYIRQQASIVIEKKKDNLKQTLRHTWKGLEGNDLKLFETFYQASWKDRLSILTSNGIMLYRLLSPIKVSSPPSTNIPFELIKDIPILSSSSPFFPLARGNNFDGVSSVCTSSNDLALLFGNNASELSLLREFYSLLLSKKNTRLCHALEEETKLKQQFAKAKITRVDFESKLLAIIVERELIVQDFSIWLYRASLTHLPLRAALPYFASSFLPHGNEVSVDKSTKAYELKLDLSASLPRINLLDSLFVFDTGAMNSVMSPSIFKYDYYQPAQWIKDITFNTVDGRTISAPYVRIPLSDKNISSIDIAIGDVGFEGILGIIGIDFLMHHDWSINLKTGTLSLNPKESSGNERFKLVSEYQGIYRALEFLCPDGTMVRVDTGSEVDADLSMDLPVETVAKIKEGSWSCGGLKIGQIKDRPFSNSVLFSRGVKMNLGWPWLKQYSKMIVSFSEGWISFVE